MTIEESHTSTFSIAGSARTGSSGSRLVQSLLDALREQSWFVVLTLSYLLIGYAISTFYGRPFSLLLYSNAQLAVYLNLIVAFLVCRISWIVYKHRPEHPGSFLWNDMKENHLLHKRLVHAVPVLLVLPLAVSAYTSIKALIPMIQPYAWDYQFAVWDAALHGGAQPWELLQPIVGIPRITNWIDNLYAFVWVGVLIGLKCWLTFTLDPRRVQLLVTFMLCWMLLGSLAAIIFSSVGPVYYGHIVAGTNPFAPLVSYLSSVGESYDLKALVAHDRLWQAYISRDLHALTGISAMPSMHLSMGVFTVLVAWRYHWALRALALAYLAVLLIGSVHLGWHYAIDGYVAILGTTLIWWAVGRALAWQERRANA